MCGELWIMSKLNNAECRIILYRRYVAKQKVRNLIIYFMFKKIEWDILAPLFQRKAGTGIMTET